MVVIPILDKNDTERRGFFATGKACGEENTIRIVEPHNAEWREKDRRECLILIEVWYKLIKRQTADTVNDNMALVAPVVFLVMLI